MLLPVRVGLIAKSTGVLFPVRKRNGQGGHEGDKKGIGDEAG